jgi:hypothetical protein
MPAAKYKIKDRAKRLATRFDAEGNEDAQGRKWSEVHVLREKTKWVCGTVRKKVGGRRFYGNYKVKCDGDNNSHTSNERHTFKDPQLAKSWATPRRATMAAVAARTKGGSLLARKTKQWVIMETTRCQTRNVMRRVAWIDLGVTTKTRGIRTRRTSSWRAFLFGAL